MTVVGQFNCGFILARTADNHLWILDQHACDERANFERLCTETVIHEQRLLAPIPLELSPTEEICVMDNLEIFEKNGFRFRIDHAKPPRHRLALTALPQSGAADGRKAVVFGKDDVSALCAILQGSSDDSASSSAASLAEGAGTGVDGTGKYGNNAVRRHAGGMVVPSSAKPGKASSGSGDKILARLPKAIAMFASRACRSSIMIGKVLSDREMDRVVAKMKDLSDPWTCAHGRPTIRHVSDLHPRLESDERRVRSSILGATTTIYASQQDPASAASTSVEPGSG
jgi:DNA mismatch repair protein PMS2